ncbi:MAG: polysaccharide pyruvyl transferase family protein [Pseudomonadales bacterium]
MGVSSASIGLYWSRSKPNFGDALAPLIVARISGRPVRWAPLWRADLVALGSLLGRLRERWWQPRVHVWGAGFIEPVVPHATRHLIHATRGPLTARALGLDPASVPLGDPGLLADQLMPVLRVQPRRRGTVVVPHYRDRGHPLLSTLAARPGLRVLDVFQPPLELLEAIRGADCVLSTSLHGLIAADALGVPNAWVTLGDQLRGGHFKFLDYYAAFGLVSEPKALSLDVVTARGDLIDAWARPGLDGIRERLHRAFPLF